MYLTYMNTSEKVLEFCEQYTTQVVDSGPDGRGEGENGYVMIWISGRFRDSYGCGGNSCSIVLKRPLQNPILDILALGNG